MNEEQRSIDARLSYLTGACEVMREAIMELTRQSIQTQKNLDALIALDEKRQRRWVRVVRALRAALELGGFGHEKEDQ